jgi:hypothetical protein
MLLLLLIRTLATGVSDVLGERSPNMPLMYYLLCHKLENRSKSEVSVRTLPFFNVFAEFDAQ